MESCKGAKTAQTNFQTPVKNVITVKWLVISIVVFCALLTWIIHESATAIAMIGYTPQVNRDAKCSDDTMDALLA